MSARRRSAELGAGRREQTLALRLAIPGAMGRMGQQLLQAIEQDAHLRCTAVSEQPTCPDLGRDLGELLGGAPCGVALSSTLEGDAFDVLIDFTRPEPCLAHVELCLRHGRAAVIGTTGFSAEQLHSIERAAQAIPIVLAANMSVGVNLCLGLLRQAAQALHPDYDIEVVEAHHRHKVDAPSGTALAMGQAMADALGLSLDHDAVWARVGETGPRPQGAIGFATVRGGDIVGEHDVLFAGLGEQVRIGHRATDRAIFARGALRAARWVHERQAGLYTMQHVLGLSS